MEPLKNRVSVKRIHIWFSIVSFFVAPSPLATKFLQKKTLNFNWYLVTSQIATYSLSLVFVIIITDLYKCGKYFVARRDQAKTADIYLIKLFIALTSQTCLLYAKQCSAAQSSSSFIHIKNILFCLNVFFFF